MNKYESRFKVYDFLSLPDLPRVHWSNGAGWLMAEFMYDIVKRKHRAMLAVASYLSLTADETTAVDNCSYIAMHCYVLHDWIRVLLLLHLQKMESSKYFGFLGLVKLHVLLSFEHLVILSSCGNAQLGRCKQSCR
jgi:hypothetical protein